MGGSLLLAVIGLGLVAVAVKVRMGIPFKVLLGVVGALIAALGLWGFVDPAARPQSTPQAETPAALEGLRPEVDSYLRANPALGAAASVEQVPDWAQGPRQRVRTAQGSYLFYMQSGEVVTVYRDESDGTRTEIWRKP